MKRMIGRDWIVAAGVAVLLGVLALGSSRGKGKSVPVDDRHRPLYQSIREGRTLAQTELVCATCHGPSSIPLPKRHPPKDQCLLCHPLGTAA